MKRLAVVVLAFLAAPAAGEENLVSGLSQDVVQITSNYTGTELTVFGAIEQPSAAGIGDIVVVVRGPQTAMTVRRKDRIAGIWINNARARMVMPSYYFLASTRPLERIASAGTLGRHELGLGRLNADLKASDGDPVPFVAAVVRAEAGKGLYRQNIGGVEMLGATLFRVHVPLPATVPRGSYNVEVYLFRDGEVIGAQSTPLYIDQTGFERRLFDFAHSRPYLYGLCTVLMAIFFGWFSTLFFRKR